MRSIALGAMLVGSALGGVLGELVGLRATLFLAVFGTLLAALWLGLSPVRSPRERPVSDAEPAAA